MLRTAGPRLRPAPYPAGTDRRVSYAGCHGWAIPRTCGDLDGAVALVERLCSVEIMRVEASVGGIPARTEVLDAIEPVDDVDAERLEVTRRTIASSMITYPPLERFPRLEDVGAAALGGVLTGTVGEATAVEQIRRALGQLTSSVAGRPSADSGARPDGSVAGNHTTKVEPPRSDASTRIWPR
jgi:hypothetical protein